MGVRTIEPSADLVAQAPSSLDWSDWGLTLSRIVKDDSVDYAKLMQDQSPLDRTMAMMARLTLDTARDGARVRADLVAAMINCYNASMVWCILETAQGDALPATVPADLGNRYRLPIGGRLWTPADLRAWAILMAAGDWRVQFALCDGRRDRPPLPPRPFFGDTLDAQLNETVRTALLSPQIVSIDHGEFKRLRLWRPLYDMQGQLIRDYERRLNTANATIINVLAEWSDRDRRELLNTAVGYEVAPLPADSRLNALEPPAPPRKSILTLF